MSVANVRKRNVFVSYNHADQEAIERFVGLLKQEEIDVWWDGDIKLGQSWLGRIDAEFKSGDTFLACVGPHGIGPFQRREFEHALALEIRGPEYLIIPVILPGGLEKKHEMPSLLQTRQYIAFARSPNLEPSKWSQLIAEIRRLPWSAKTVRPESDSPYPGLISFTANDSFFFGREAEKKLLLDKIRAGKRFLAIVGASGGGKSSLMAAGLVRSLREGVLPDSDRWKILSFRPTEVGPDPLQNLAAALARQMPEALGNASLVEFVDQLRTDSRTLHLALARVLIGEPTTIRAVIAIDQFEENFTSCTDPVVRAACFDALLYAADQSQGRVVIVVTMRADFYQWCIEHGDLAVAISQNQLLLSRMDEKQLRDVIELPAQRAKCVVENGLTEVLLEVMKGQEQSLPLLQFALREIWLRGGGHEMTLEKYNQMGGLKEILDREATRFFTSLSDEEQHYCREIFLRLVTVVNVPAPTRRRTPRAELLGLGEPAKLETLIEKLVAQRFLAGDRDQDGWVEVTHEYFIEGWRLLSRWIEEDRGWNRIRSQLTTAAAEWNERGNDEGELYRGARLLEADEWVAQRQPALTGEEREFLNTSREAREAEAKAVEAQRRRELQLARYSANVSYLLLAGVVFAVIYYNYHSWQSDRREALARASAIASADIREIPRLAQKSQRFRGEILNQLDREAAEDLSAELRRGLFRWMLTRDDPARREAARESHNALLGQIFLTDVENLQILGEQLAPAAADALPELLRRCREEETGDVDGLLRTAAIAAGWKKGEVFNDDERQRLVKALVDESDLSRLAIWFNSLAPMRLQLRKAISEHYLKADQNPVEQNRLAEIVRKLSADDPETLATLLQCSSAEQFRLLFPQLAALDRASNDVSAILRAAVPDAAACRSRLNGLRAAEQDATARIWVNAAAALIRLKKADDTIWSLFESSANPLIRSMLIHSLVELEVPVEEIIHRLPVALSATELSTARALLQALGEYPLAQVERSQQYAVLAAQLDRVFAEQSDAGLHSTVEWLWRRWNLENRLEGTLASLREKFTKLSLEERMQFLSERRGWFVNLRGQTMVILEPPGEFEIGVNESESQEYGEIDKLRDRRHRIVVDRRFAIGQKEIPVMEFDDCAQSLLGETTDVAEREKTRMALRKLAPGDDMPLHGLTWHQAAMYCNWLSITEGLTEEELCYSVNEQGEVTPRSGYLTKSGYRLPTEAEWEYACRAGTNSSRYFGDTEELLKHYAWYSLNTYGNALRRNQDFRFERAGLLKPNEFGLFDALGSCDEWCHESFVDWRNLNPQVPHRDVEDLTTVGGATDRRTARGGSLVARPVYLRASNRYNPPPDTSQLHNRFCIGVRVARTLPSR